MHHVHQPRQVHTVLERRRLRLAKAITQALRTGTALRVFRVRSTTGPRRSGMAPVASLATAMIQASRTGMTPSASHVKTTIQIHLSGTGRSALEMPRSQAEMEWPRLRFVQ